MDGLGWARGLACLLLISVSTAGLAQSAPPAPPTPPAASPAPPDAAAAPSGKQPSAYVKCDGNPNNMSGAELAARLIALSAVVGLLAPPPEQADLSKRLSGQAGIDACNEILEGPKAETNAPRRARLILARAIHRIEIADYDGAIRDAHLVATDQPALAATAGYRLGLGLSVYEIEAQALLGKGQPAAAKQQMLAMAAAAPYDLLALLRAARYIPLTDSLGPEEQRFWAALSRAHPESLYSRAAAREAAGDYAGAAHDYEQIVAIAAPMKDAPVPTANAHAALAHGFSGNAEKARQLIATAREQADAMTARGKSADTVTSATELIDFYAIWDLARQGQLRAARLQFAGRSRWTSVSPAMADRMAAQLRAGAAPDELIGTLAKPAGSFSSEAQALRAKLIRDGGEQGKDRYNAIRETVSDGAWAPFAANIWRDGPSRYLTKTPNKDLQASAVFIMRPANVTASGYALLLDCARSAQKMGKPRFQLLPGRKYLFGHFIRFGSVGDPGVSEDGSYDAATVEKDLAYLFPRPR
jgi:hypothetical protein